jgi:hypothetical protein
MPDTSVSALDSVTTGCKREIEYFLKENFGLDSITFLPFSAGTHWVSIPLKVAGRIGAKHHIYAIKVITTQGLRAHQDLISSKNARFAQNKIGLAFCGSTSAYELLEYEALFLKTAKRANVLVPTPFKVFELTQGAALAMEFVEGMPLQRSKLTENILNAVFSMLKQLRRHQLVHGDIRRDNFIKTIEGKICLIDHLRLVGSVEKAMDYDLMSAVCHLSLSIDATSVLNAARGHFSAAELREAIPFLSFITGRLTKQERGEILRTISAFS